MIDTLRAAIVPFFIVLFPAVWYVNRNLTTAQLPPSTEPSVVLIAGGLGASVVGSAAFAVAVTRAVYRWSDVDDERELVRYQRIFRPDNTSLAVFAGFISLTFLWAVVVLAGVGPAWVGELLSVPLGLLGLPFVLLLPLGIRFHWAVVLGLVCSVVWMMGLATVLSDTIHRWSAPDA
ncbi:hypothetical protein [Natrinema sp. SYSU A 869]|uniref:hypothetical protein n=1 Tax=Natrinema sp. SYSU A 869 TaxID=2871694 RepID=UPI001CA3CF7A|nr:hypothetical protein [Natrinema sp. SYSU A 869]